MSNVTLEVLALLLMAAEERAELHGWQIMKAVHRSGPVVYNALDRLEDAGWISASWEVLPPKEDRPRRRYYKLTAVGAEAARQRLTAPAPRRLPWLQPGFSRAARPVVMR